MPLSFKNFLQEDIDTVAFDPAEAAQEIPVKNINSRLSRLRGNHYVNPYAGLQLVRQILAHFHIHIPNFILTDMEDGETVFPLERFGEKVGVPKEKGGEFDDEPEESHYYVYFAWQITDDGHWGIDCEVITDGDLEEENIQELSIAKLAHVSTMASKDAQKRFKKKDYDKGGKRVDLARKANDQAFKKLSKKRKKSLKEMSQSAADEAEVVIPAKSEAAPIEDEKKKLQSKKNGKNSEK